MSGIDWEYWKGRVRWSLEEGCKLVCRVDPNTNTQTEFIRNLDADTRGRPAWVKLLYKARTAIQAGTLQTAARPVLFTDAPAIIKVLSAVFLAWAQGQGVTIPIELDDIAGPAGGTIPGEAQPSTTVVPDNKPTAKRKAPDKFVDALIRLIAEISKRAAQKGIPFDKDNMPGTKKDFMALAIKFDDEFEKTPRAFDDYLAGLLRFKQGVQETPFYQELFPEFFDPPGADPGVGTHGQGRRSTRGTPTR